MSDTVIKVENLSKSYIIGHQSSERYMALRDVWAAQAKSIGRRLLHPFKSSTGGLITADETEEFWALDDVSFEIKQGDRVGIIGRNGAGKSTLLKVLSRITEPTKGRVTIDGRVASLLEVGTGFHPELTGRENVFLNGAILGMTRADIKKKFDEIVAFAEVERFLDTPVKRYSSGMYVRLAFAVAAHLDPEILVIDEVLAVGDAQFQKKCLGKMEDVASGGRTILFVSHNMAAVQKLCNSCLLLESGTVAVEGNTSKCVSSYLHAGNAIEGRPTQKVFDDDANNKEQVNLQKVVLSKVSGEQKAEFRIDEAVHISIAFEVSKNIYNFHLYARVFSSDGSLVFASADWDINGMNDGEMKKGNYVADFVVPGDFLNTGNYMLSLDGLIPNARYVFRKPHVITWEVLDMGGAGGLHSITRKGYVRPILNWNINVKD